MDILVSPDGRLRWLGNEVRCALGRSGVRADKREGDGATPIGAFPLRRILFRPDRLPKPATGLPTQPIEPELGWCDDPARPEYNQLVRLPFAASHERLWRDDGLYDVLVVIGHNDDPVAPGAGSAIFLHVAEPEFVPTEGCVALTLADLLRLLVSCGPGDRLVVGG